MQSASGSGVTKRPAGNGDKSVESNQSKEPTLVDQLKDHYNNRDFSAKPYHLHRMGIFSYLFCLFAVPLYCVLFVLPTMDLSTVQWIAITIVSLFVMGENFLNFGACVNRHHDKDVVFCFHCNKTNPLVSAAAEIKQVGGQPNGWRACLQCQQDAPPRSHHCKICGECVLRRDHHCYFTSCCIGHYNQKHFLVLCLYSIAGLLMGIYFVSVGLTDNFQAPLNLFLPITVFRLFFGSCSLTSIGLVLSVYLQAGCLCVTCIYLFLETVLVLRGQTFFEMGINSRRYNLGVWGNLRLALGAWYSWPLLLLYPINTEQGADGVNWSITKNN